MSGKDLWIASELKFQEEFFTAHGREATDNELQLAMPAYYQDYVGAYVDHVYNDLDY